ncbi:MAG: glutaminase [Caulobacteraceae bacterium]
MISPDNLAAVLAAVRADVQAHIGGGRVADYIPALAGVDPNRFGLAVATLDGTVGVVGDVDVAFSIQSISKVFALALALEKVGDSLWRRVGREASGSQYNSGIRLEEAQGIPCNPFINAGAMVVCDALLSGGLPNAAIGRIGDFVRRRAADDSVRIDLDVAQSELATGFRNASLANFLKSSGNLVSEVEAVLDVYFHQCALAMNCRQLARAGLFLANGGVDPLTGESVASPARARRINAMMMTCGHYDESGDFAFRVGLPGKSGVGGGILAVAPGAAALAVWSPGLSTAGTSVAGAYALECLAERMDWSVF